MAAAIQKEQDRGRAIISTLIFHAALVAILFLYRFSAQEAITESPAIMLEWGGGGDNAAAGLPDEGQGDNPAPKGQQMEDPAVTEPAEDPVKAPSKSTPPPASTAPPKSEAPKTSSTTTDPEVAALRKAQEDARRESDRQQKAREDATRQAEADRQTRAKAESDRQRQVQEEKDKKKGQFGGTFGKPGSSGTGQGNTGKPGNQGIPGGTGDNPFGKSSGTGGGTGGGDGTGTGASVGGGLGGRTVVQRGRVIDNSQKSGKVVIEVCVDGNGSVVSADYTQRGSTTNDSELRGKALSAAKQYRFAASNSAKECGNITFNFQLH